MSSFTPQFHRSALLTAALLFAFLIGTFSPSSAEAQDVDAIEERLVEAVKNKEISLMQAGIMMQALHEAIMKEEQWHHEREARHHAWRERHIDERRHEFEIMAEQIEEAFERGKITKQEAEKKMHWLEMKFFNEQHEHHSDEHDDAFHEHHMRQEHHSDDDHVDREPADFEHADDHDGHDHDDHQHEHSDHQHEHGDDHDHEHGDDHEHDVEQSSKQLPRLKDFRFELARAVAAGKLTKAQADRRLDLHQQRLKRQQKNEASNSRNDTRQTGRLADNRKQSSSQKTVRLDSLAGLEEGSREWWQQVKNRIESEVKSGNLSRAEADAAYKQLNKRLIKRKK